VASRDATSTRFPLDKLAVRSIDDVRARSTSAVFRILSRSTRDIDRERGTRGFGRVGGPRARDARAHTATRARASVAMSARCGARVGVGAVWRAYGVRRREVARRRGRECAFGGGGWSAPASGLASTAARGGGVRANARGGKVSEDEDEDEMDEDEEDEDRAAQLAAILNAYDETALATARTNVSTYVRERIAELTPRGKIKLLGFLSSSGIENAWVVAGEGYGLTREERAYVGADGREEDFHVVNEIIGDDEDDDDEGDYTNQVYVFEGKVSKLPGSFLNRFAKAFYIERDDDPMRSAASRRFLGRAPIRKGPLDGFLPLYFASNDFSDDSVSVPGTGERADLALDYRDVPVMPNSTPLDARAGGVSWPRPRLALYPFNTLVDYLRPLGPGVIVGRGYRLIDGVSPKKFLSFVLVRSPSRV